MLFLLLEELYKLPGHPTEFFTDAFRPFLEAIILIVKTMLVYLMIIEMHGKIIKINLSIKLIIWHTGKVLSLKVKTISCNLQ